MNRSRLNKRLEKKSLKNLALSVLGIVIVTAFLIKFGVPLFVNLSLFVTGSTTNQEKNNDSKSKEYIMPPVINPLYNATNSAQISVSGTALKKQIISLYINNKIVDKTKVKDDNSFSFSDISLKDGENFIKAKSSLDDQESSFSDQIIVIFKNKAPSLAIDSPTENQNFSKDESTITINGKTDPGVKVTANDLWVIVNSDGSFSQIFKLQNGENKIKIIAVDEAGNKTEIERKVNYSP
ncbi:MAG: hypothetical protein M1450_04620 [Patescibacteria group bacterium]|nr:hypothetical protein [Patescibacteria group bacterium]